MLRKSRFISEAGRLILDILEITDSLQIDRLLMTIEKERRRKNVEKAFNYINHFFLIFVLKGTVFEMTL